MHKIYCSGIKLPTTLMVLDWIWCREVVKIHLNKKQNKASSESKDDTNSKELGTMKWVTRAT